MGFNSIGISQLSLQYIGVPVKATTLSGAAFNPTSDTVQMAFMPTATQVPQTSDWQTAVWATVSSDIIYPYAAYCLVGPGGTITLGIGTYVVYLKIVGSPEIPVMIAGQLQVQLGEEDHGAMPSCSRPLASSRLACHRRSRLAPRVLRSPDAHRLFPRCAASWAVV